VKGRRAAETAATEQKHGRLRLREVFSNGRLWTLIVLFFGVVFGAYGLGMWLPTIVKGFGDLSGFGVGAVSAIPYVCVMAGLLVVPRLANRREAPFGWLALMLGFSIAGFLVAATASAPWLQMIGLCVASIGGYAAQPVMWGLVPKFLAGATAAAGIAAINGIGNLGGGFGPMGIAAIVDATGSAATGLYFLIAVSVLGLFGTYGLRRVLRRRADTAKVLTS